MYFFFNLFKAHYEPSLSISDFENTSISLNEKNLHKTLSIQYFIQSVFLSVRQFFLPIYCWILCTVFKAQNTKLRSEVTILRNKAKKYPDWWTNSRKYFKSNKETTTNDWYWRDNDGTLLTFNSSVNARLESISEGHYFNWTHPESNQKYEIHYIRK